MQSITPYVVDNYYDLHIFGTNNYLAEGVFHHNSGKSLALYLKLILFAVCFPGNRILLGRKTLSDIERAVLPDLFELIPKKWYVHKVKEATINFFNDSQIILFGLDALQAGDIGDIKKAQQKIKSLNLGAFFIDQLEEVEYEVFEGLTSRLRRTSVPVRQGNMTTNPANFWAYHYFLQGLDKIGGEWIDRKRKNSILYQSSMLDNKMNLPEEYIQEQLAMDEKYVKRYVLGEWTTDLLTDRCVFPTEYIRRFEVERKRPIMVQEECEIYEEPRPALFYQMGVDPSEGAVDPSSISVVSSEGKKVAKFNGKVNIPVLFEKVKFLYGKYNKPLIVPEINSSGVALLEMIKDFRIYRRRVFEYKEKKEVEKLGFRTTHQSKQALISHFLELLRKNVPHIFDSQTIEELKTFVWQQEIKHSGAGAQRGFHDDDVMSTLLAYWEFSQKKVQYLTFNKTQPKIIKRFQYY